MDLIQRIFCVGDPVKVVSCLVLCILVPILCHCKPQLESSNGADVIAEQAANMKSYMDESATPCDDFYKYACGKWDTIHKVPEDMVQFSTLQLTEKLAMDNIEQLLNSPNMPANVGEAEDSIKKAKQFYSSCMNTENIEKLGKEPLKKLLEKMGGWPAINSSSEGDKDWLNVLVETRKLGEQLMFYSEVSQDLYNTTRNTLYAYHPFLGLLSRHDFEEDDGKKKKELKAYEKLIAGILKHFGIDDDHIKEEVKDIVKFETDLAAISLDTTEITNLTVTYNPAILEDLTVSYPEFDWLKYYSTLHNTPVQKSEIIIASKDYLKDLMVVIKDAKPKTIVNYLLWRIVQKFAPFTGSTFDPEFEAFNKDTIGTTKTSPRKEECIKYTIEYMGPAVGFLYIQTYFNIEVEKDAKNLLERLKNTFRNLLEKNEWLDKETKNIALEKLDKMGINIGYPHKILKPSYLNELYKDVPIKEDDFFSNIVALIKLKNSQESKKIGTLVGKDHWDLDFLSAGALYPYPAQAIFITALMFRPPLYHKDFPKLLNYGLLGTSTAHEMSNAFDSKGITFNQDGDMKSWFSNSSFAEYTHRTKCFINKYSNLSRAGVPLNGEAVLNTAIADDVGIKVAFTDYKKWIDENENSPDLKKEVLPGFNLSKEKMFFLSFAQLYCNSIHEKSWPALWKTEEHALANYRVNTVLSNSKYFAETFGCSLGTAMNNSTERCEVW